DAFHGREAAAHLVETVIERLATLVFVHVPEAGRVGERQLLLAALTNLVIGRAGEETQQELLLPGADLRRGRRRRFRAIAVGHEAAHDGAAVARERIELLPHLREP